MIGGSVDAPGPSLGISQTLLLPIIRFRDLVEKETTPSSCTTAGGLRERRKKQSRELFSGICGDAETIPRSAEMWTMQPIECIVRGVESQVDTRIAVSALADFIVTAPSQGWHCPVTMMPVI